MTIIVILGVIFITNKAVIIVLEIVDTSREFHVTRKSVPFIYYSMTEEVTSRFTYVCRLGEVESGYNIVIWSQSLPKSCSMIVVSTGDFEEGGDRQIIDLMQDLIGLEHGSSEPSFRQRGESYLPKLLLI